VRERRCPPAILDCGVHYYTSGRHHADSATQNSLSRLPAGSWQGNSPTSLLLRAESDHDVYPVRLAAAHLDYSPVPGRFTASREPRGKVRTTATFAARTKTASGYNAGLRDGSELQAYAVLWLPDGRSKREIGWIPTHGIANDIALCFRRRLPTDLGAYVFFALGDVSSPRAVRAQACSNMKHRFVQRNLLCRGDDPKRWSPPTTAMFPPRFTERISPISDCRERSRCKGFDVVCKHPDIRFDVAYVWAPETPSAS